MTQFCVFSLYGPMASWGEIAVGETRHSADHPTKSAVIGMVAAALGIRRDEEEIHSRLGESLGMACLVRDPGIPVQDYHTVQTPREAALKQGSYFLTRRDELSLGQSLETIISSRDYRCDTRVHVCLWKRGEALPCDLGEIAAALNRPRFTLYLGRKSCPPGLPVCAKVIEAASLVEAFSAVERDLPEFPAWDGLSAEAAMYWDADGVAGIDPRHVVQRRDAVLSRKRWTFLSRAEHFEMVRIRSGEEI